MNKTKTDQLLLYKQFYGGQNEIPLDKIEVEYFIVKRKLYEKADFPQKRIQKFTPANGKPSVNKVLNRLQDFMSECYTEEGKIIGNEYEKCPKHKKCYHCRDL